MSIAAKPLSFNGGETGVKKSASRHHNARVMIVTTSWSRATVSTEVQSAFSYSPAAPLVKSHNRSIPLACAAASSARTRRKPWPRPRNGSATYRSASHGFRSGLHSRSFSASVTIPTGSRSSRSTKVRGKRSRLDVRRCSYWSTSCKPMPRSLKKPSQRQRPVTATSSGWSCVEMMP